MRGRLDGADPIVTAAVAALTAQVAKRQIKALTSQPTAIDSTTPADIAELLWTATSGRIYLVRGIVFTATPTAADGIKIDFDVTSGCTFSSFQLDLETWDAALLTRSTVTLKTTATTLTAATAATITRIEGRVVASSTGPAGIRIGKEADAGAGIAVQVGSHWIIDDIT